jgi:hypothetical protein
MTQSVVTAQTVILVVVIGLLLLAVLTLPVLLSTKQSRLRGRIEALFRRPPRSPMSTGRDHYYKPYWQSR